MRNVKTVGGDIMAECNRFPNFQSRTESGKFPLQSTGLPCPNAAVTEERDSDL